MERQVRSGHAGAQSAAIYSYFTHPTVGCGVGGRQPQRRFAFADVHNGLAATVKGARVQSWAWGQEPLPLGQRRWAQRWGGPRGTQWNHEGDQSSSRRLSVLVTGHHLRR